MPAAKDTVADEDVLRDIASVCSVPVNAIEDLYPCTALQVGIMAQPIERIYINCVYATLAPSVDADAFCRALCHVYQVNPVLRTRIVDCELGLVQVVLKEALCIDRPSEQEQRLDDVLEREKAAPMNMGTPLFRAVLLGRTMVLTTHHAISDGGTYHRLFEDLSRVYRGQDVAPHANFKLFVKHCLSIDEDMAKAFWSARFTGHPTIFPKISVEHMPDASKKLQTHISFGPWGLTAPLGLMSSYIETAWAITARTYTNADSVVFGRVLSARVAGLGGLASTSGPTIVTMPVQVTLNSDSTIAGLIKARADERRETLQSPALQYGLIRIRDVNEAAKLASRFTTLLNFRTPTGDGRDYASAELDIHGEYDARLPYALGLSIVLTARGLAVETLYDDTVVCERQTRRVLAQFAHVLTLLLQSPAGTRLGQLPLLNPHDRRELLGWNRALPPPPPRRSLHNMFRDMALAHPESEAVEGPDGSMTYADLDRRTDVLACQLADRGIGAEDAVALVFDKSTWAVVAQLAVLKAGAVCVPIDPGFPLARIETILSNAAAKAVLTSEAHVASLAAHKRPVVVIDGAQIASQPVDAHSPRRPGWEDAPSRAAFILFTSGSTGTPKGHVLEHRNLASSLVAIGREMKWGPGVRMLQFAAYVWDMSIAEILGTLVSGGCVCIPSEEARASYIEEFIQTQRVNCAIFTPTVLRMITPQGASSLTTIMSIGEPVDVDSVTLWASHARFFNAWGPSETACVSAMAELTPQSRFRESIGRPLASALWLVDEKNVDSLVPIGGIGEIVVESHGVARGYLNDARQTAAAFIAPPSWAPPREARAATALQRMYRTGDLARHRPDGSLEYVGRLDSQVKIHGQRVELGEVEKALSACANVRHAMAVMQQGAGGSRLGSKDLVAVLVLDEPRAPPSSRQAALQELPPDLQPAVAQSLDAICDALAARLPMYMIPSVWKVVADVPRTASWKIDRAAIKKWLAQWALARPRPAAAAAADVLSPPASPLEACLQATWARALCVPEHEIGRESSFIRMGGDSILAIKVATLCRKRGVRVSVATLLRSASLAEAATASHWLPSHAVPVRNGESLTGDAHGVLSVVPLSPFQRLVLRDGVDTVSRTSTYRHQLQCWNAHVTTQVIQADLVKWAEHHPMLRACLVQRGGEWTHVLISMSEARQHIHVYLDSKDTADLKSRHRGSPHGFCLDAGFKFNAHRPHEPPVIFVTSSSWLDKCSWMALCRDLESLLMDSNQSLPSSPSFADWIATQTCPQAPDQEAFVHESKSAPTGYWDSAESPSHDDNDNNKNNTVIRHQVDVDAELADAIFGPCNRSFSTTPIELLVTAVLVSFAASFADRGRPALHVQQDGRDAGTASLLDFSRTVGNFTTLVPIVADIEAGLSPEDAVIAIKDSYRSALGDKTVASIGPRDQRDVEILFRFEDAQEEEIWKCDEPEEEHGQPLGVIRVFAQRLGGKQLRLFVEHDRHTAHQERLRSWVASVSTSLSHLASHLARCAPRLTLSEAPLRHLDTGDLREMQACLDAMGIDTPVVEAVLPCSPLQEGILLSQLRNPCDHYWMRLTMKLTPTRDTDEHVDMARIKRAWDAVCAAQPILRTIFVSHETSTSAFQQVILKSCSPSMSQSNTDRPDDHEETIESTLDSFAPPPLAPGQPPHHLHLVQPSPALVYARLHINHALLDERSMQLLGQLLGQAYTCDTARLRIGPSLAAYLAWTTQHRAAAQTYWTTRLSGVAPSLLPVLTAAEARLLAPRPDTCDVVLPDAPRLGAVCRRVGVTVPTLLQVAWAVVLRRVLGAPSSVCFGYLHSHAGAREGALADTLGPLLAMAVCRFEAGPGRRVEDVLVEAHGHAARAWDQGACALGEMAEHVVGVGAGLLFNTIMTVYRLWPSDLAGAGDVRVEHMPLGGRTEYAMTVGVGYDHDSIVSKLLYDTSQISHLFASQVAAMFATVVSRIVADTQQAIETLEASVQEPALVLSPHDISTAVYREAAAQCEQPVRQIQDIVPCPAWQRAQMAADVHAHRRGLDQYIFKAVRREATASADTIQAAWKAVQTACPAVRTRLVSLRDHGVCHVTLTTSSSAYVDAGDESSLAAYLAWDKALVVRYGGPLCRFARVREPDGTTFLVLSVHPLVCDPWTLTLVRKALAEAAQQPGGIPAPMPSLGTFMRRLPNRRLLRSAPRERRHRSPTSPLREDAVSFPAVLSPTETHDAVACVSGPLEVGARLCADVLCAAWALCLSRITGDANVCFGMWADGRNTLAESAGAAHHQVVGSLGCVVPVAVDLATTPTTELLLQKTRDTAQQRDNISRSQYLDETLVASPDKDTGWSSCRNVLIVDESAAELGLAQSPALELVQTQLAVPSLGDSRLVVLCRVMAHQTAIEMHYDEHVLPGERVAILMEQYKHAVEQLACSAPLVGLQPLSRHELALLQTWNSNMPLENNVCVHDQIRAMAAQQPTAPAICSWDCELDRGELDDLSERVAALLQQQGMGAGIIVPYFLDKSATAVIVMLGILKAGGSLLPLDMRHPTDRIQTILAEAAASRIVVSSALWHAVRTKVTLPDASLVVVDMPRIRSLPRGGPAEPVTVQPSDRCYIIYTSGSTGQPKGIMVTHANFSTSVECRRNLLNLRAETRTLQYLNLVFDVALFDVFLTLRAGGCVCLPSADEWANDMAGAIRRTRANFAFLTPSLATLVDPRRVPTLQTLGLTGEPFEKHVVETWRRVRVWNMYGPAEATVHSSGCDVSWGSGKHPLNIGRAGGCLYWVVDAADHNRLVPVGCPGELLIQGPIVARGYLGDPDQTAAAFIDAPAWAEPLGLLAVAGSSGQRWYKTGDLVVQTADGSVLYQGRKDTQVKVSGQRIEMGEIEHHLRRSAPSASWDVAVELVQPSGHDSEPCLAVFFAVGPLSRSQTTADMPCDPLPPLARDAATAKQALAASLPAYMVPRFFVRLTRLPLTASGKTDRASLRRIGANLSSRQRSSYHPSQSTENGVLEHSVSAAAAAATTPGPDRHDAAQERLETTLQTLWSETLHLPQHSIHPTDDFFAMGGSSIRAMRLSHAARRAGLPLSATDVFQTTILSDMAALIARNHGGGGSGGGASEAASPVHEAPDHDHAHEATARWRADAAFLASCAAHAAARHEAYLVPDNIESIAPATDLQADMVAVGELDGEAWHNEMVLTSSAGLDMAHLVQACKTTIRRHQIMRTVFVQHGAALYQIALKEAPLETMITTTTTTTTGAEKAPDATKRKNERAHVTGLDTYLPHFYLEDDGADKAPRCSRVRLQIHHALYDAIAMGVLLHDLSEAYHPLHNPPASAHPPPAPSFHRWASSLLSHAQQANASDSQANASASRTFWRRALAGASAAGMTALVPPSVPTTRHVCRDSTRFRVPLRAVQTPLGTPASVVQAAWAVVLARATGDDDVVFCAPTANRTGCADADRVCGLCLSFQPARARLETKRMASMGALIRQMQAQAVAAIAHQHLGFRAIVAECTNWPAWTRYGSVLIYQNHESLPDTIRFGDQECALTPCGKFGRCADLLVEATPSPGENGDGDELVVDMLYSSSTFTQEQIGWLSRTFADILESIPQSLGQPVDRHGGPEYPLTTLAVATSQTQPLNATDEVDGIGQRKQEQTLMVRRAWVEVGIKLGETTHQRTQDWSMFDCGADLVTTMLLARYYQGKGHMVSMQDLVDKPTLSGQADLIGPAVHV